MLLFVRTRSRNKDAFGEYDMHFNVLSGLKPPLDMGTKVFGEKVSLPFFACPTAGNRMFHNEGESAVAKASAHHGSFAWAYSVLVRSASSSDLFRPA